MNILILNWRDIKNPQAGGAEVLTHEIAKRWVGWGHEVVQVSSGFSGAAPEERIDGVLVLRRGRWWTVHFWAALLYLFHYRNTIDQIVDEVHWYPFFSLLYARKKTVLLACEVAGPLFDRLFPFPLNILGRQFERLYLWLYRNTSTLAISQSTKNALIQRGFRPDKITVLPMGVTYPSPLAKVKKKKPALVFLGRLHPLKGVEDAIEAFCFVRAKHKVQLWILGTGNPQYVQFLQRLIARKKLTRSVIFYGHVSELKKYQLLSQAKILFVPSVQEGWGLVVVEAGVVGTPAVAYRTTGLRDVIHNGQTGLVTDCSPEALAQATVKLLADESRYRRLSRDARSLYRTYNWESTAKEALRVLISYA